MGVWAKLAAAAALAALVLAAPASAQVPDPFARELAQKLSYAEQILGEDGYSRAAGPFAGGLAQGAARRFPLTLRAGQDYRIVGVCDQNCGDVALRLYDPDDALIARDVPEGGVPVMHVRPAFTGSHMVEVATPRCGGAQCWYAVNVYSR
ncbi:MAG: hypothetical protein ABL864_12095 [Terricaulis sp.]|jgi:hypothetical protein